MRRRSCVRFVPCVFLIFGAAAGGAQSRTASFISGRADTLPATRPESRPFVMTLGRDLDGDGAADFYLPGTSEQNLAKGGQTISLVSGKTGAEIRNILVSASAAARTLGREDIYMISDRNGDGVADIALFPWADRGQMLAFISGTDGAGILNFFSPNEIPAQRPSQSAFVDLDGDGVEDVVLTTRDGVIVYNGATGAQLYLTKNGGLNLCIGGDLNLDGMPDLAVGGDAGSRSKAVYVYSGKDGSELMKIACSAPPGPNPGCLASAGDVNGDGFVDFIVGSPRETRADYNGGTLRNYSGATGGCFREKRLDLPFSARFGEQICCAGDVDGDGVCDVFVSGPRADARRARSSREGMVALYSPHYGTFIWRRDGDVHEQQLGEYLRSVGDVDGDGICDVLASIELTKESKGGFVLLSGKNGSVIRTIER